MVGIQFLFQGRFIKADTLDRRILNGSGLSDHRDIERLSDESNRGGSQLDFSDCKDQFS